VHITVLELINFKNYKSAEFNFGAQINCLFGSNGAGKTNVLDALYYLSFTKSYFNSIDQQNINHEESFFVVSGQYSNHDLNTSVRLTVQRGQKKLLKVNNNEYQKFSEHIGEIPLVIIAPGDINLVADGSEERRKFIDSFISQIDKVYLSDLVKYNRILDQRNRLLKNFTEERYYDSELLMSFNSQIVEVGNAIYQRRLRFFENFIQLFSKYYKIITSGLEEVSLNYISELNQNSFSEILKDCEGADRAAMRSTKGIHKDDVEFRIDGFSLKKFGSQGQQKSFVIALKLAQFAHLSDKTGFKPLLLLDDIFEKIDDQRLNKLLKMISEHEFGQIFITDTHEDRLRSVLENIEGEKKFFKVVQGSNIES